MSAYHTLEARFRRLALVNEAANMLEWDTATMMPAGSADARAEQSAALALTAHELLNAPDMADLLADSATMVDLSDWQRANLREMQRQYRHSAAVPARLVEQHTLATGRCEMAWRAARRDNDFKALLPLLRTVLELTQEIAAAKAAAFGCSLYDALLDAYEPDGKSAEIDRLFDELAGFLPDLIGRAVERRASRPPPLPLDGPFPVAAQRALGARLMAALGFDFERGRLDVSHHPFCGGTSRDIRITTRYDEGDFTRGLMGVLHETGHALYEFGRPDGEWRYQPLGSARGMAMHESQSLMIEMQLCRGVEFLTYAAPLIRQAFGRDGAAWSVDNLAAHYAKVERSLIRVDADEVTYPAHVILRYRLERAMISGDLDLADLPGAWAELMRDLVGIVPATDRDGCLQDIHWPCGAWGYFPTYTLGATYAAQLFAAVRRAIPDLGDQIASGEFGGLLTWLRTHIHGLGSSLSGVEILQRASGSGPDVGLYRRHLETRYLS